MGLQSRTIERQDIESRPGCNTEQEDSDNHKIKITWEPLFMNGIGRLKKKSPCKMRMHGLRIKDQGSAHPFRPKNNPGQTYEIQWTMTEVMVYWRRISNILRMFDILTLRWIYILFYSIYIYMKLFSVFKKL